MAIGVGSHILKSDMDSIYNDFNSFIRSFGGSIAQTNPRNVSTFAEAWNVNNLNAKINEFRTDEYLKTQISWWVANSNVSVGDYIRASQMTNILTTRSNFSKVKCRNRSTNNHGRHGNCCNTNGRHGNCCNANGNNGNCCNTNGRHGNCCNTNGNHGNCCNANGKHGNCCNTNGNHNNRCSNSRKGNGRHGRGTRSEDYGCYNTASSCSYGTNRNRSYSNGTKSNGTKTNGTHSQGCANGNHNQGCANGNHGQGCANGNHNQACANGNHGQGCGNGNHGQGCANGNHNQTCSNTRVIDITCAQATKNN